MLNFFTKALIKRQLKDMPSAEVDKVFAIIDKNPAFFTQMATSIQDKMNHGMTQEQAMKSIIEESGEDMKKMLG